MERELNLKKLERNTAAVIFQTGIVDLGIGMIFLVLALAMFFDDIRYYIDILFIVPPIFIFLAKKYIVDPRMGYVEFSKKRVRRSRLMSISITIFLVIMVSMTFFGKGNFIGEIINPRWIITGIIFSICISIAYFLEYNRMYLYAFILSGAFNLSEILRDHREIVSKNGMAYLIASVIILCIGGYYLATFLKKYRIENESY